MFSLDNKLVVLGGKSRGAWSSAIYSLENPGGNWQEMRLKMKQERTFSAAMKITEDIAKKWMPLTEVDT